MKRSVMGWSAAVECGGIATQGRREKYYPSHRA
jgi:hypothetical protein